jgi:tRNA pseudouridine38-40 synthase
LTTWRLTLAWDGAAYSGWQRQDGAPTIQACVEDALGAFFGVPRVVVHASGRTDAGVHALAQVVSFVAQEPRSPEKLRLALNTLLPRDIACLDAAIAPEGFHARFDVLDKTYRYVVLERRDRCPFRRDRALHLRGPLDWASVEAALPALVGPHDFTAFSVTGTELRSPIRTITRAEHLAMGEEHRLEFTGDGFLRYQVRRMVGTLLDVAKGRLPASEVAAVLASGDRGRAGKTAPPGGLYLVGVRYASP